MATELESAFSFLDVSDNVKDLLHNVKNAVIGTIIGLVGIVGNVINIVVFSKQGFSDTVNVSLFALSLSDLGSLILLELGNLFRNSLFLDSVPVIPMEAQHLIAGWPHVFFTRVSGAFTAYITMERCLCVLIPLRVKIIFTPQFSAVVLISTFFLLALTLVPDYSTCYYGWKFQPNNNKTLLGLLYKGDRETMAGITFLLAGVTQLVAFVLVILFTSILVIKLNEKSKWRASTSSSGLESGKNRQSRDNKTVLMVILIAVIYCICFLPHVANYTLTTLIPEFNVGMKYNNAFCAAWATAFLVDAVNATLNTFVYYRMSSKYRNTFRLVFPCTREQSKDRVAE